MSPRIVNFFTGVFIGMGIIGGILIVVVMLGARCVKERSQLSSTPALTLLDTNGSTNEFIWMPDDSWKDGVTLLIRPSPTSTNGFDSNSVIAVRYKPIVEDKTSNGFWIIRFK